MICPVPWLWKSVAFAIYQATRHLSFFISPVISETLPTDEMFEKYVQKWRLKLWFGKQTSRIGAITCVMCHKENLKLINYKITGRCTIGTQKKWNLRKHLVYIFKVTTRDKKNMMHHKSKQLERPSKCTHNSGKKKIKVITYMCKSIS